MELYKQTAHELHEQLVNKKISSVELTNALYERINEVDDKINAYLTLDQENALAQAAKVDSKIAAGEVNKEAFGDLSTLVDAEVVDVIIAGHEELAQSMNL